MTQIEHERDMFRRALVALVGTDDRKELIAMREMLKLLPDGEAPGTVQAIDALLETHGGERVDTCAPWPKPSIEDLAKSEAFWR